MRLAKPLAKLFWNGGAGPFPARHYDDVGPLDQIRSAICYQGETAMGPQRTVIDRATGKPVPVWSHLWPRKAENLGNDPELERAQAIVKQRNDKGT